MLYTIFIPPRLRRVALLAATAVVAACGNSGSGSVEDSAARSAAALPAGAAEATLVTVYKSPTCGCCTKWVEYMRDNGFQVVVHDTVNVQPVKTRLGLPGHLASCHTATVGDYVVEGHVPVDVVRRLLRERPQIAGIAVPGMPMGSPGMEGLYKDDYDVVAFTREGTTQVYESR